MLIYIAAGLAVLGAVVIAYGFYFRPKKKEDQKPPFLHGMRQSAIARGFSE